MKSLRINEFESYRKHGFTTVGSKIFAEKDFQALKSTVNNILRFHGNKEASTAVGFLQLTHPEILFWILSDNILDVAEDVLGPNIGYLNSTIFFKKARTNDKAHWHTDTSGFERYNLFEDKNQINLTLSITRSDASNGGLRCIPGSHLQKFNHDWQAPVNDLITNPHSIREDVLDTASAVPMQLGENEVSLHNVNVVHGSEPNLSDDDRITLSTRFFSASSRCNVENFKKSNPNLRPFLVRGHDVANSQLKFLSLK